MIKMRQVIVTDFRLSPDKDFGSWEFSLGSSYLKDFFKSEEVGDLNIDQILPCLTFIYLFMKSKFY